MTNERTKRVIKNALHAAERREISLRLNASFKGLAEANDKEDGALLMRISLALTTIDHDRTRKPHLGPKMRNCSFKRAPISTSCFN